MERDESYYLRRAREETAKAEASANPEVTAIHEELARQYQALADQGELRTPLRFAIETGKASHPAG